MNTARDLTDKLLSVLTTSYDIGDFVDATYAPLDALVKLMEPIIAAHHEAEIEPLLEALEASANYCSSLHGDPTNIKYCIVEMHRIQTAINHARGAASL